MSDILDMRFRVLRSGRRHKVSVPHIRAVLETVDPIAIGDQLVFIGLDDRGIELEIVAVRDHKDQQRLAVIHAMPTSFRRGGRGGPGKA